MHGTVVVFTQHIRPTTTILPLTQKGEAMTETYHLKHGYRILYIGDDMGLKYRVQRYDGERWNTVEYFATYGEAKAYYVKATYGLDQ